MLSVYSIKSTTMSKYRYPGAQPFKTEQNHIFFGRGPEIKDFHQYIALERLVVLYSKSGLGKSSLLNAGLIPQLEKEGELEPISLRFGAYVDENSESPLSLTQNFLGIHQQYGYTLDKLIPAENSLWYVLKSRHMATGSKKKGFVLIFDQFEELFTYPREQVNIFQEQLAELIYTPIPQRFLEKVQAQIEGGEEVLTKEEMAALHYPIQVKAVLAIRSDRMHSLNQMTKYFPNILSRCFELGPLSREGAEDAIINPAFDQGENFLTPPFDYTDDAIERILHFLTKGGTENIASFQLQILCQSLERKVFEGDIKLISEDDIGDVEKLYQNYYDDQLSRLNSEEDELAARHLIEDGLIFEEEERRLSMYEGQIISQFHISKDLLTRLVDCHILRSEPSSHGGYTYELSHDTLVAPVLAAKQRRLAAEREAMAEQERLEQERQQQEILATEKEKSRRAKRIAVIGMVLTALSVTTSIYALSASKKARIAEAEALEAQEEAQEKNRQFEIADSLRRNTQIERYLQDYQILKKSEDDDLARLKRKQIEMIDPDHPSLSKMTQD